MYLNSQIWKVFLVAGHLFSLGKTKAGAIHRFLGKSDVNSLIQMTQPNIIGNIS